MKTPTRFFGLSRTQAVRLIEALRGSRPDKPGVSYLADQGFGLRAARPWYQTFQSLQERGLVELGTDKHGHLVQAYRITIDGRQTAEQILRSHPELGGAA
jgi:hypothetical protein